MQSASTIVSGVPALPDTAALRVENISREDFVREGQAYLKAVYEWLQEANPRLDGNEAVELFSEAHDQLLEAAFDFCLDDWKQSQKQAGAPNVALVALGGYGRRALTRQSDIDIMMLMEKGSPRAEGFVKCLLHLLYDLRLNLGFATRTVSDCLDRFGNDVESVTAMTESRFLVGHRPLFDQLTQSIQKALNGRHRRWFLHSIYETWKEREQKFGDSLYLLQPNLKEGRGGLRDYHSVIWVLCALGGSTRLSQLQELARFDQEDLWRFENAVAMIQKIRNELHLASNAKGDQLLFEFQPAIARRLGYKDEAHRLGEEMFMADYYNHARAISRLSNRAMRVLARNLKPILSDLFGTLKRRRLDGHVCIQGDVMYLDPAPGDYFEQDPGRIMALFERANGWGLRMSDQTIDALARVAPTLGPAFRLDPLNQQRFMNILKSTTAAAQSLKDMHESGILDRFLPEFERIRCMVRIDHYHHFTVDEHTLRAIEVAGAIRNEKAGQRSFAGRIAAQIRRWDLLNLALLLHDVGKGFGRGHALLGGQIAQRVCERLRLPAKDIELVRFLVLSHLKLSHAAQRRDMSDPEVAQQLAEEIGSLRNLKMLYVHTVCDLMAVSPDAWSDWKGQLLAECYMRVAEVLGEAHPSRQRTSAAKLPQIRARILEALEHRVSDDGECLPLNGSLKGALDEFLDHCSIRYLESVDPEAIARHFMMRQKLTGENLIVWDLDETGGASFTPVTGSRKFSPAANQPHSDLTVYAVDVPGLFSYLCGALAAKGINIQSAQIFSTTDGYAINHFEVTDLDNRPLPPDYNLDRLRRDLNLVIRKEKTIEELMEKHATRHRRRSRPKALNPSAVVFDNVGSKHNTIVEIRTTDQPGLLYRIASALVECRLNIQRAIITTEAYGVADVFYVTDLEFNKIYEASQQKKIEQTILKHIEG